MKKLILTLSLLLPTLAWAALPNLPIGLGGTGTTTFPNSWYVVGNNSTKLTATTSLFKLGTSNGCATWLNGYLSSTGSNCGSGGGAGGAGTFSTTSDGLAQYPNPSTLVTVLGRTSTTTTGKILEVEGNSQFNLGAGGYVKFASQGGGNTHAFLQSTFGNILFNANSFFNGSNWVYDLAGYHASFQAEGSTGSVRLNTAASGSAGATFTPLTRLMVLNTGEVGIATNTPQHIFTSYSASAPQLSLSNGAGSPQWVLRNAGGTLFFATTTVSGTATTSTSALTLNSAGVRALRIATTTTNITTGGLALGSNGVSGTTTISMGKIQFDGYNSANVRVCTYLNSDNDWTVQTGPCNQ